MLDIDVKDLLQIFKHYDKLSTDAKEAVKVIVHSKPIDMYSSAALWEAEKFFCRLIKFETSSSNQLALIHSRAYSLAAAQAEKEGVEEKRIFGGVVEDDNK